MDWPALPITSLPRNCARWSRAVRHSRVSGPKTRSRSG